MVFDVHEFALALRRRRVLLGKDRDLSDVTLGGAEVQSVEFLACMARRLTDLPTRETLAGAWANRSSFRPRSSLYGHELKYVATLV